jgi:hypothetical protein
MDVSVTGGRRLDTVRTGPKEPIVDRAAPHDGARLAG